jgi:hypothetical protein
VVVGAEGEVCTNARLRRSAWAVVPTFAARAATLRSRLLHARAAVPD